MKQNITWFWIAFQEVDKTRRMLGVKLLFASIDILWKYLSHYYIEEPEWKNEITVTF